MKQKDIITLLVPAFILVIAWIIFSIYHNTVTSTTSQALNTQIIPIDSTFDTKTIEDIKKREIINPIYELQQPPVEGQIAPQPNASSSVSPSLPATGGGRMIP